MGSTRYEFGSPAWFAVMGELVVELVAANPDESLQFVFSEEYLDAPAGLAAPVGWHVSIRGRDAEFHASPSTEADLQINADFTFARETMAEVDMTDPSARRARRAELAAAYQNGLLRIVGDPASAPKILEPLHDLLASRTVSPTGSNA